MDTWTPRLCSSASFPIPTVLCRWKYDFHLWQRSVRVCQNSPHRGAFLRPKMTHSGHLCERPGRPVTCSGLVPRAGWKSSLLPLTAHFPLSTASVSPPPSGDLPCGSTKAPARFGLSFANSHRFLRHGVSSLPLESNPSFLSPWNIWGTGSWMGMAA